MDIIDTTMTALTTSSGQNETAASPQSPGVALTGLWTEWTLCDTTRRYGTIQSLTYADAERVITKHVFNGQTGKGQQRELVHRHALALKRATEAGEFTPTPVSAALNTQHAPPTFNPDGTFRLVVNPSMPLLLTDGGHRLEALRLLVEDLEARLKKAKDPALQEKLARWLKQAQSTPLTVTVYFDGDPQKDFVNLQAGRRVDPSHVRSLALQAGTENDPALKAAFGVARLLHQDGCSPFHKEVKFDSRGHRPLPIATLTATGGSDLGTSLVGLAKVGLAAGKSEAFLAAAVADAYVALQAASTAAGGDGILEEGKVLTPIENNGSKGASTMLVGIGLCLAHWLVSLGKAKADEADLARLVEVAGRTLNVPVQGNFAGPFKRQLLGRFAKAFFADATEDRHGGVPVALLQTLSCSTFDVQPLPKSPSAKAGQGR